MEQFLYQRSAHSTCHFFGSHFMQNCSRALSWIRLKISFIIINQLSNHVVCSTRRKKLDECATGSWGCPYCRISNILYCVLVGHAQEVRQKSIHLHELSCIKILPVWVRGSSESQLCTGRNFPNGYDLLDNGNFHYLNRYCFGFWGHWGSKKKFSLHSFLLFPFHLVLRNYDRFLCDLFWRELILCIQFAVFVYV